MRKAAALVLLAGLAGAAQAAPDRALDVRASDEISTGSFDEPAGVPLQRTTLRVRYRAKQAWAQAELPWLRVAGTRETPLPPAARTDQGLGDVRVKVGMPLRAARPGQTGLDLVVRAKVGRGTSVGGLAPAGPGQAVRLAAERPMNGWSAFGHVGVRRAGDLPGSARGRHAWEGEIGASRQFTPKLEAGAMVDVRGRMPAAAAYSEASLYAAVQDAGWKWQFFLSRQLGRGSRDVSAGLVLRAEF